MSCGGKSAKRWKSSVRCDTYLMCDLGTFSGTLRPVGEGKEGPQHGYDHHDLHYQD